MGQSPQTLRHSVGMATWIHRGHGDIRRHGDTETVDMEALGDMEAWRLGGTRRQGCYSRIRVKKYKI